MRTKMLLTVIAVCFSSVAFAQEFEETMGTLPVMMSASDLNEEGGFRYSGQLTYEGDAEIQYNGCLCCRIAGGFSNVDKASVIHVILNIGSSGACRR